jgi:hypothetical protein
LAGRQFGFGGAINAIQVGQHGAFGGVREAIHDMPVLVIAALFNRGLRNQFIQEVKPS